MDLLRLLLHPGFGYWFSSGNQLWMALVYLLLLCFVLAVWGGVAVFFQERWHRGGRDYGGVA